MDHAGVSAAHAADTIGEWLAGRATEDQAIAGYRELRDASVLESFAECTSLARDLSRLAPSAG
jgi:hypothetical protein